MMGALSNPIYAREALLPMPIGPKAMRDFYVPFVDPTEALTKDDHPLREPLQEVRVTQSASPDR